MSLNRARRAVMSLPWMTALAILILMTAAAPVQAQREVRPPRLVVFIVIDQLRGDYLTRFRDQFGNGGFQRLMDSGAHFANAHFSYGYTTTAPGHATIATGRNPREHGIVANDWYQGRPNPALKAAVYDPDVHILVDEGGRTEGRSPRNLIGATLGDQIKLADRRSRVYTVALKDRAAILLGGRQADGAFWFDLSVGQFVSSDWYSKQLPAYVRDFNKIRWAERFANSKWDRALPPAAYDLTWPLGADALPNTAGLGPQFPHMLPRLSGPPDKAFYTALYHSPFGHDVTLEMAKRMLSIERLGTGEAVDFLGVSLSSFDAAGHVFGPESAEMMDFAVRTDRQIAAFLELLDHSVGLSRCIVALTGDHGVTSSPRVAELARLGGGRIDVDAAVKQINATLSAVAALPGNRDYIGSMDVPWVRLDPAFEGLDAESRGRVLAAAKSALLKVEGVAAAYTADELSGPAPPPADGHRLRAWQSYRPGRSGELFLDLAPYWAAKGAKHADHSDGSDHSRHVPIVIMGGGMRPGRYLAPADPADIAVTVAALLGIEPPIDATGRVLTEAIDFEQFGR